MVDHPTFCGVQIRFLVLGVLVFQNAVAVLLMKSVRATPGETEYVTQTMVIMQEVLKGMICIPIIFYTEGSLAPAYANMEELFKTAVPAVLYLLQNNLQYISVGYLDAPTYAVVYQSKLIWVAVFSVIIMGKELKRHQWYAVLVLIAGICSAQLSQEIPVQTESTETSDIGNHQLIGIGVLLFAACCSSLAAVSFEKLLKGVKVSLWVRNLQLAGFSLLTAVVPLFMSADGGRVMEHGFFHGYTLLTWTCIVMNGCGGLLIGAVISYADAMLKDIAIGASIVVSSIASIIIFDFVVNSSFLLGVILVSYAVPMYAGRVPHSCTRADSGPDSGPKFTAVPQTEPETTKGPDAAAVPQVETEMAKTSAVPSPETVGLRLHGEV